MKALLRLYYGSTKAILRLYQGYIKAISRLYEGTHTCKRKIAWLKRPDVEAQRVSCMRPQHRQRVVQYAAKEELDSVFRRV
jgi:hypothetical protein